MKKHNKLQAFTLVELIITIVILSILATIAFLSFSSYSSSSRDSVRLSDISNIAKGLVVQYSIGGSYIIPDNSINIYSGSTTIIGYQGKVLYNTGMGQYTWTCGGVSCKAYDNYNVLLFHFDGNFSNSGTIIPSITNNGGVLVNSSGKFGNGASFNGSQFLQLAYASNYNVGSSDFTVDGWVRFNNVSDSLQGIFGRGDLNWVSFLYHGTINKTYLWLGNGAWIGSCNGVQGTKTDWINNQWYHFAFVRTGSIHNIYINGILDTSCNSATAISDPGVPFVIGASNNNSYLLKGSIDEFRFSKGIARRTNNFNLDLPNSPY